MRATLLLVILQIAVAFTASINAFKGLSSNNQKIGFERAVLVNPQWANVGQFPYQVSITSQSSLTGETYVCSGTLISSFWVLTSASCVTQSQVYRLRFGAVTYYTGGAEQTSHEAYIHPFYNPNNNTNDVALIRIPSSSGIGTQLSSFIRLAAISQNNATLNSRVVSIPGWGRTVLGDISPVLQFGYGQILQYNHPNCNNRTGPGSPLLCATIFSQSAKSCVVDSGSPLVIQISRTFQQVGVATFDSSSGNCKNSVSLFTNIYSVREWISNITSIAV